MDVKTDMNKITLYGMEYKVVRCGFIPYIQINNDHFKFLMPHKRGYDVFGDFGGGIHYYETYLQGLSREITEESSGIFGDVDSFLKQSLDNARTQMMVYQTKHVKRQLFLEYLIDIKEDKDYISKFADAPPNEEHEYLKWIDIKRNVNGKFDFTDIQIKIDLCGSLKPLITSILDKLSYIVKSSHKPNLTKFNSKSDVNKGDNSIGSAKKVWRKKDTNNVESIEIIQLEQSAKELITPKFKWKSTNNVWETTVNNDIDSLSKIQSEQSVETRTLHKIIRHNPNNQNIKYTYQITKENINYRHNYDRNYQYNYMRTTTSVSVTSVQRYHKTIIHDKVPDFQMPIFDNDF